MTNAELLARHKQTCKECKRFWLCTPAKVLELWVEAEKAEEK